MFCVDIALSFVGDLICILIALLFMWLTMVCYELLTFVLIIVVGALLCFYSCLWFCR